MPNDHAQNPVVRSLRDRFMDTTHQKLDAIDAALDGTGGEGDQAVAVELKQIAHSIKGMAGSFGFMSVTRISEAFEDYLAAALDAEKLPRDGARRYNDAMRGIIESGDEPSDAETDAIIAELPAPTGSC